MADKSEYCRLLYYPNIIPENVMFRGEKNVEDKYPFFFPCFLLQDQSSFANSQMSCFTENKTKL